MDGYNLVSFAGIFILIGFAWLLSPNKKCINWRLTGWGLVFQLAFAGFIFHVPFQFILSRTFN